jgi:Predicted transcriptional regulators
MTLSIGDRIKSAREAAGLSRKELADRVGVSNQSVWLWETGDTKGPRPEHLLALRNVLKVSIDWLVLGKGEMFEEDNPYRIMNPRQKAVLDLYEALPESAKKEFLQSLQEKKQYFDMILQELLANK